MVSFGEKAKMKKGKIWTKVVVMSLQLYYTVKNTMLSSSFDYQVWFYFLLKISWKLSSNSISFENWIII
mgnify:CR=1 FL=1